ncbi:hypothetical protein IscW_ISCW014389, partial [Ixodes scapularis]
PPDESEGDVGEASRELGGNDAVPHTTHTPTAIPGPACLHSGCAVRQACAAAKHPLPYFFPSTPPSLPT